jgi:hypothetical protein
MQTGARPTARDDFRLWSTAIAVLAILLQTLVVGLAGASPAAALTAGHSVHVHGGSGSSGDEHRTALACTLCCISCAVGSGPAPQAAEQGLRLAIRTAAPRRCHAFPRRKSARPGAHLARGPPRSV